MRDGRKTISRESALESLLGHLRPVRSNEPGEGENQGSGIGNDASVRGTAETQNS